MPFQAIETVEETNIVDHPAKAEHDTAAAMQLMMALLGTLSKRVLIALSNCFTLLTVASAFWLWWEVPNPNPTQLVSLGMYAVFVLAVNFITKRA